MVFSAVTSFGCIAISTFTYIQSSKISDQYLLRFMCCLKGRIYLEAVVYFWISVISLIVGIGCVVYLLGGQYNMIVAVCIGLPMMVALFVLDQGIHSSCVHYMHLQSAPILPPSPPIGIREPVAVQNAS